ncbi:hypothetical protein KSP39_PZI008138 [Platanthera zijinensis]|uniref:Uncharacterized protein n=1 Tax=Platanthera zijinensis TaxID=2320716 RepID=A0AAP0BP66_9ASPA
METLISDSLLLRQSLYSISSILPSSKSYSFSHSVRRRCRRNPNCIALCRPTFASSDPVASIYGGWEELEFPDPGGESGMLESLGKFVMSLGIDDRKHALPFLLGILAAFAVSRVRFSTVALLPFSLLVFLGGFAMGAAQNVFLFKKLGRIGSIGALGVLEEKLSHLEALFSDVDVKMSFLRKGLERCVESDDLGMGLNESYLQIVEHVRSAIGEAQKTLTDSFNNGSLNLPADFDFGAKKVNQKQSRKRMELRTSGVDFLQFLTSMLRQPLTGSKKAKSKDAIKEKLDHPLTPVDQKSSDREELVAGLRSFNPDDSEEFDKQGRIEREVPKNSSIAIDSAPILNNANYKFEIDSLGSDMLSFDEQIDNQTSRLKFMTSRGSFQKIVYEQNRKRTKNVVYSASKSESSSLLERTLETKRTAREHSYRNERSVMNDNEEPVDAKGEGKLPYSSNISTDGEFEQNIQEAMNLLKRAREHMMTRTNEEEADFVLYKAAELLSSAVATRPKSLIAVGQLGNAYLLHGELKLKVSRELRTLLLRSDSLFRFESFVARREDIAYVLVSVCEECESLLVEAGRRYRTALSIDRNDVRALYNWGIALCFRAQLIADVGPEAAVDADKVYLAAIDKFNAMMSGGNAYAPDVWSLLRAPHLGPCGLLFVLAATSLVVAASPLYCGLRILVMDFFLSLTASSLADNPTLVPELWDELQITTISLVGKKNIVEWVHSVRRVLQSKHFLHHLTQVVPDALTETGCATMVVFRLGSSTPLMTNLIA